jgi:hypothetical protein
VGWREPRHFRGPQNRRDRVREHSTTLVGLSIQALALRQTSTKEQRLSRTVLNWTSRVAEVFA